MAQLISALIFYVVLFAIFVFVFLIWRYGVRERARLAQTLVDATLKSADAAKEAAEAVRILAEKVHPP